MTQREICLRCGGTGRIRRRATDDSATDCEQYITTCCVSCNGWGWFNDSSVADLIYQYTAEAT